MYVTLDSYCKFLSCGVLVPIYLYLCVSFTPFAKTKTEIPHTVYNLKLIVGTGHVSASLSFWVMNEMELQIQKERIKVDPSIISSLRLNST